MRSDPLRRRFVLGLVPCNILSRDYGCAKTDIPDEFLWQKRL
jgi:hypothetical protein